MPAWLRSGRPRMLSRRSGRWRRQCLGCWLARSRCRGRLYWNTSTDRLRLCHLLPLSNRLNGSLLEHRKDTHTVIASEALLAIGTRHGMPMDMRESPTVHFQSEKSTSCRLFFGLGSHRLLRRDTRRGCRESSQGQRELPNEGSGCGLPWGGYGDAQAKVWETSPAPSNEWSCGSE